jgi:hypothetical protein
MADDDAQTDPKREWITRVLGYEFQASGGPAAVSLFALGKAALEWRNVCARLQSDIGGLKSAAVSRASGIYDEDELPEVTGDLNQLDAIPKVISPEMEYAINDVVNAAPEARPKMLQKLVTDIDELEGTISKNELIAAAEDNGFRSIDLSGPALAALRALRAQIRPLLTG